MMNWGEFPKMKKSSRYFSQDALHKAGCDRIFTDTASGSKTERVGLEEALRYARKGDTFVVWRLDRLGRSLPHLIATMTSLEERDSCQLPEPEAGQAADLIRIILGQGLLYQPPGLARLSPGVQAGLGQPAQPGLILETQGPVWMGGRQAHQPVPRPLYL
jgi:hypothetical protein